MSDDHDPDSNDIDAFLRGELPEHRSDKQQDEQVSPYPAANFGLKSTGAMRRLEARLTHIERSLTGARQNATMLANRLDEQTKDCAEWNADADQWGQVLEQLENILPHADLPAADDDSLILHENIADAVAAQDDDPQPVARQFASRDLVETTVLPDDYEQLLAPSELQPSNDAANGDPERLLQFVEAQDSRIRELESQLRSMQKEALASSASRHQPYVNRLVVAMNGTGNLKYPLTRKIMTIGREPHNDIHIRSRYVSRFHARIVSDSKGSVVEDLDSRNGVMVNAQKVRRQRLRSGDLIDLGKIQLKFIDLMEGSSDEGSA